MTSSGEGILAIVISWWMPSLSQAGGLQMSLLSLSDPGCSYPQAQHCDHWQQPCKTSGVQAHPSDRSSPKATNLWGKKLNEELS